MRGRAQLVRDYPEILTARLKRSVRDGIGREWHCLQRTRCPGKVWGSQTECHVRPGGSSPGSKIDIGAALSNLRKGRPRISGRVGGIWVKHRLSRPAPDL